jgi:hypothetical protein
MACRTNNVGEGGPVIACRQGGLKTAGEAMLLLAKLGSLYPGSLVVFDSDGRAGNPAH